MDVILPHQRGKRKQARNQGLPLDAALPSTWKQNAQDVNEPQKAESKHWPPAEETASFRQAFKEDTHPQARWRDDWSHLKPDERGAELAREARVWKVYVGETDKWDREVIEGWEKSMDVLLVFAALFSAISSAFLIESSGMLKQDPNDVSAEALLIISQTLVAIAAGNSSADPASLPQQGPNTPADFSPPQIAVIVNVLWYMSLSLSIATAFIAMLAKDWCYSFSSHRTGHPHDQAYRRQRKWKMIERWKMEELIIVLPSLMHLSLLLFSVGLCIYLWDLNRTTAIPVICISGLFFTFYVWSSIAASVVEFFPYTTIVSRILRSKDMRGFYTAMAPLGSYVATIAHYLDYGMRFILLVLVWIPGSFVTVLSGLLLTLDHYSLHWFAKPGDNLSKIWTSHLMFFMPIWFMVFQNYLFLLSSTQSFITWIIRGLKLTDEHTASLALGWLIGHCETPSAVDIALQAISGASHGIPKKPLLSNRATEQILERIMSGSAADSEQSTYSRYTRGLEFLGLNPRFRPADSEHRSRQDILAMMWNLKSKNERKIAELIKNESFIPSEHNIEAMRIGNSATSECLRFFMGEAQSTATTVHSIAELLTRHFDDKDKQLHPAAIQSLANAAVLYLSLPMVPELSPGLVQACMNYCDQYTADHPEPESVASSSAYNLETAVIFIVCVLLHRNPRGNTSNHPAEPLIQPDTRTWHAMQALGDVYTRDSDLHMRVLWIAASDIVSRPSHYGFNADAAGWWSLERWCSTRTSRFMQYWANPSLSWRHGHLHRRQVKKGRNSLLIATSKVYAGITTSRHLGSTTMYLPSSTYTILATIACSSSLDSWQSELCYEVLSAYGFPQLSTELTKALMLPVSMTMTIDGRETVLSAVGKVYIKNTPDIGQRRFAAAQLWLLFQLAHRSSPVIRASIDSSDSLDNMKNPGVRFRRLFATDEMQLKRMIERELENDLQLRNKGYDQVKSELETFIIQGYRQDHQIISCEQGDESWPSSFWSRAWSKLSTQGKENSTQQHRSLGSSLNRWKSALQTGIKGSPQGKYQKAYMARVVEYILATSGLEGNEDLLPLLAEDLKEVPAGLRRLPELLVPLPVSRPISRTPTQTDNAPVPDETNASHTSIEVQVRSDAY